MSQLISLSKNKIILSLAVLATLIAIQLLCFGPIVSHVGFYLDDWATLSFLHFAPKAGGYLGLLKYYLLNDSRVLIRPLEVLHFGTVYYLCGDKPLGYHLLNLFFEVASAFLLFKIVARLSAKNTPALLAALLLLLYPSHDSTRYWVICSSVALSLLLYLGSLQAAIIGTDKYLAGDKKKAIIWQAIGFALFFLSLLNYEIFLPLAAVTVLISALLAYRTRPNLKFVILPVAYSATPLILAAVALLIWLKLVPLFGHGYAHALSLEPAVMLGTIWGGLVLTAPVEAWQFFSSQAEHALAVLTTTEKLRLAGIVVIGVLASLWLTRRDHNAAPLAVPPIIPLKAIDLFGLGLLTIFLSYTIFGLSRDYMPTYITLVNRVNTGASLGVALILASTLTLLSNQTKSSYLNVHSVVVALTTIFLLSLFTLADWGLAKPWIVSWTTQKEVRTAVASLRGKIDPKATLLLISCPRYVMWSPVFDGVWDFQNMARITLNQPNFNANVVSERMSITKAGIKDVSYGYECGVYPFNKLFVMVAPHPELYPITTGEAFADIVEARGLTFGLDKKTLSKWREQCKLDTSH